MNDKKDTAMDNVHEEDDKIAFKKEGKDSTSLTFFAAFIVILVIVSVIAYRSGVDVKQLENDVAAFKTNLQNRYAKAGQSLTFDYKNVTAEGGILSKTIKIAEPSLTMGKGKHAYKVSAASMHIVPDDAHYKTFDADLYAPVIIQSADSRYVYKAEKPLPVKVTTNQTGLREYSVALPKSSIIDVSSMKGDASYTLDTQEKSTIEGAFSEEKTDIYMVNVDLNKVSLANAEMKSTATHFGYNLNIEEGVENEEINVQALISDYIPTELTPVSIDIAQQVTRDKEKGMIAFDIQQFIADHASYNLDVEGDFTIVQNQLLPLANIGVELKGADYVLNSLNNSNVVPSSITNVIGSVLTKVAPNWNKAGEEPLTFKVQRTDDAPFMIGAVKADELFAIALKEWYVNKNTLPFTTGNQKTTPSTQNTDQKKATGTIVEEVEAEVNNATQEATEDAAESTKKVEEKADTAAEAVSETIDDATDAVGDAAESVGDAVGSFFDDAKEKSSDTKAATQPATTPVSKAASTPAEKVDAADQALENAKEAVNEKLDAAQETLPEIEEEPKPAAPKPQQNVQPKVIKVPAAE